MMHLNVKYIYMSKIIYFKIKIIYRLICFLSKICKNIIYNLFNFKGNYDNIP